MDTNSNLMDMLVGYASAHQHPFNIAIHLVGIPLIMLGVLIPLSWVGGEVAGIPVNLAHVVVFGLGTFYLSLDRLFATVFLVYAMPVAWLASRIGMAPVSSSGSVAAAAFFGGYAAQFIGHAVERSVPVILKHPVQANLAAPFFIVVEVFKILGLRKNLFDSVQREISVRRNAQQV
jgi:uncharacterized membrane protein YGL010W